jgi:peptidyl-prolyl cis-trans isomerase D
MLQSIRDRATGWVAWTIVILICIPFALWGVYDYMTPSQGVAIATVNGVEVDARRFTRLYQQQRYRLLALLGDRAPAAMIDDARLREQALEQLIDDELVIQVGLEDRLRIADRRLAEAISSLPQLQGENGFSQELYDAYLRNQGLGPLGFEFEVRRNLLIEEVLSAVARAVNVSDHEYREARRLATQRREYATLRLPASFFRPAEVDESDVREYFDSNRRHFSSPEQVNVEYLELSRDDIAHTVLVEESELRSLYEERKADYTQPAQREARHILVALAADAEAASEAAARERIEEILRRLADGMSFEAVAREYSDDPGSSRRGGALGWFSSGVMDPAFEDAAFGLAEGERSDVVRTPFGLHLIEVTGRREAGVAEFDEVRDRLREDYQLEVAEQLYFEQVEQLANLAFEHPDTLEVAAEALDVPLRETGFLSRNADESQGLAAEPRFLDAAFSPEVLEEGNNSELLEFEGALVAVLRVKEHRPSREQDFDSVSEEARTELVAVRSAERAREAGESIIDRLRGGEAENALASEVGLEWSPGGSLRRTEPTPSPGLSGLVFRMSKPEAGASSYDGLAEDNGDFVVVALRAVNSGDGDDADAESTLRERLAIELGRAELAATVASFRADADIVVNEENLQ